MRKSLFTVMTSSRIVAYVFGAGLVMALVAWITFTPGFAPRTIVLANAFIAQNNEGALFEQSKNGMPNIAESQLAKLAQQGNAASLTGNLPVGPTSKNCYSAMFFAASDCDRLASQMIISNTGTEEVKNLSQRFREVDDASWNAWLLSMKSH